MEVHFRLQNQFDYPNLLKFVDFPRLLDFLETGAFHFTRLDHFEDKAEAISQSQLAEFFDHQIVLGEPGRKELPSERRQKRYFANCWFSGKRESAAMWNLYSNPSSVAIEVRFKYFKSLWLPSKLRTKPTIEWIDRIYVDQIHYKDYLRPEGVLGMKDETKVIGLHKDESYSHEKEVRVLIKCKGVLDDGSSKKIEEENISHFKVKSKSIKATPMTIVFHPKMDTWQKKNIRSLLTRYEFLNIQCRDSELTKLLDGSIRDCKEFCVREPYAYIASGGSVWRRNEKRSIPHCWMSFWQAGIPKPF